MPLSIWIVKSSFIKSTAVDSSSTVALSSVTSSVSDVSEVSAVAGAEPSSTKSICLKSGTAGVSVLLKSITPKSTKNAKTKNPSAKIPPGIKYLRDIFFSISPGIFFGVFKFKKLPS